MSKISTYSCIEPLESRIAPALLVFGANLLGGSGDKTGETSIAGNAVTLVKVSTGQAIVWFDGHSISGISFGPNTTLDLTGDVTGDIIGNLTSAGRLSDSDADPTNGDDGNLLLKNNLLGLTTHPLNPQLGAVGHIITGGTVSKVNINGAFDGIYVGDGAFNADSSIFDGIHATGSLGARIPINPVDAHSPTDFTFSRATASMAPSASVQNVTVAVASSMQIIAGSGNPLALANGGGLKGGSIGNIHIVSAIPADGSDQSASYSLFAGDGAGGSFGGAGGSVFNVVEETSRSVVHIRGGQGGAGLVGPGGAGGGVHDVDLQGDSSRYDVSGGDGGNGRIGGAGGMVVHGNFAGKQPNTGIILTADFTGDGLDDVLVVDSSTGDMVLSAATASGSFTPVVQYTDPDGDGVIDNDLDGQTDTSEMVVKITGAGETPSDAVAIDVNGDGLLDLVVAYQNSSTLGVFLNKGGGNFYGFDKGAPLMHPAAPGTTVALAEAPVKLVAGSFGGDSATDLAVFSTSKSSSTVSIVQGSVTGDLKESAAHAEFAGIVSDAVAVPVSGGSGLIASTTAGKIFSVTTGSQADSLLATDTTIAIAGGIADLDVDSTGLELVAVGTQGRVVNLYSIGGGATLTALTAPDISLQQGHTISAHFVDAETGPDAFAILSVAGSGSNLGYYTAHTPDADPLTVDPTFDFSHQLASTSTLKNFSIAYSRGPVDQSPHRPITGFGAAALGGSLKQFTFSAELAGSSDFGLPFAGKTVAISGGDGGFGLQSTPGGAGGAIVGVSIDSSEIILRGGIGGDSASGHGGAGGGLMNAGSFVTANGQFVVPALSATGVLSLSAGHGGAPQNSGPLAAGGDGGGLSGLNLILESGDLQLSTGAGGLGRGGNGGNGGSISKIQVQSSGGGLAVQTGFGGAALSGKVTAGAGGSVSGFTFQLDLADKAEANEVGFNIVFGTGDGGKSPGGLGGAAGALNDIAVKVDPANDAEIDTQTDSTVRIAFSTGAGGDGATGGSGGGMSKLTSTSTFDQTSKGATLANSVAVSLLAGKGGDGAAGNGGAGGSILLTGSTPFEGITNYDLDSAEYAAGTAALVVHAGHGGDGSLKGGAGGALAGLVVQNARLNANTNLNHTQLTSASLFAGDGGNGGAAAVGGKGGDVSGLNVAIQGAAKLVPLTVQGGIGGKGAIGGAGGSVFGSTLGTILPSMHISGGDAGDGAQTGGKGGSVSGLKLEVPQLGFLSLTQLMGGRGGNASAPGGLGGQGGGVSSIAQMKNVNSAIDLIQAGNGGDAADGTGGLGGSVSAINTGGFLGKPTDQLGAHGAFDAFGNAQGVYSGRGGAGDSAAHTGHAGGVTGVTARQIAAIAAAVDPLTHTFALASIVSGIKADVIGYDVDHDGVFDTTGANGASPADTRPIDGFILAQAIQGINALKAPFKFQPV